MKKYIVEWGYMMRNSEKFSGFEHALDYLRDKIKNNDARMLGDTYDDESDGLTDEERDLVDEIVQ